MSTDVPVSPPVNDWGLEAVNLPGEAMYPDVPWDVSGNYVGSGPAPADTGTPGLTSGPSWWDKVSGDKGTNILKAALGVGGVAQYMAGRSAASSQRQVGELNATVLENEAQFQLKKGQIEANTSHKKYLALMGKQRAGYGASGVRGDEGSPLMVLEDTYAAMDADAQVIKWSADIAATKARNQIPGVKLESELAAKKSESAGRESLLTAGGRYWQLNG